MRDEVTGMTPEEQKEFTNVMRLAKELEESRDLKFAMRRLDEIMAAASSNVRNALAAASKEYDNEQA